MNINGLRGFLRPDTETAEYERMCILAGHPPSAEGGEMKASWAARCFPLLSRRNITGFFVASKVTLHPSSVGSEGCLRCISAFVAMKSSSTITRCVSDV